MHNWVYDTRLKVRKQESISRSFHPIIDPNDARLKDRDCDIRDSALHARLVHKGVDDKSPRKIWRAICIYIYIYKLRTL